MILNIQFSIQFWQILYHKRLKILPGTSVFLIFFAKVEFRPPYIDNYLWDDRVNVLLMYNACRVYRNILNSTIKTQYSQHKHCRPTRDILFCTSLQNKSNQQITLSWGVSVDKTWGQMFRMIKSKLINHIISAQDSGLCII